MIFRFGNPVYFRNLSTVVKVTKTSLRNSKMATTNGLLERKFIACNKEEKGQCIRVMQWNMLAQALCYGEENFVLCPKNVLDWDARSPQMVQELTRYSPDILCLEEVDRFSFFEEYLSKLGYKGTFFPKPNSPCKSFSPNWGPDGCAVFYKTDKVTLLDTQNVILRDDEGWDTNQVAIICKFQVKGQENGSGQEKKFFVGVTHFKSKTGYEEIRFQQGKNLISMLQKKTEGLPLIVCGDFNAPPKEKIYATFEKCDLNLSSVYKHLSPENKEPEYTTWKIRGGKKGRSECCHTIDYIWYTAAHLQVRSALSIPTGEEIGEKRLPCCRYPSDHIALACDLAFL